MSTLQATEDQLNQEVERNYRHNFVFNALDGSTFWLGYSFITPSTILPVYISYFTSNNFLIGLIPMLSGACFLLPQLFTSNWVERLPRKIVVPVKLGFFTERVPIFLMAPAALLLAKDYPSLALVVFFILFAWHTLGAGLIAVGWQEMLAKVIPLDRRGRFLGITNFGGTATGILGATGAAWVLGHYSFPMGYVLSFTAASLFIFLSWIFLAQTREPAVISQRKQVSQITYLRSLPSVVKQDHNFRHYLITQAILALAGMGIGFLTISAVQRWNLPDSQAGTFTAAMLIGQAAANLLFGPLADRKGHKLVLEISALLGIASYGLAVLATGPAWFYLVFALRGASFAGGMLSGIMIAFEFSRPEIRPTYIGLASTLTGVAASLSPLVGSGIATLAGYQWLFVVSAAAGIAGYGMLKWWVQEPRHTVPVALRLSEAENVGG